MIRVLVVDDQWLVTEGLEAILDADPEITVVGTAADGAEALEKVAQLRPDVVLMDLRMPVMNGIQATARISDAYPETRVLVLTTYASDEWVFDAIRGGAAGYLLKGTLRDELIAAVKGTARGGTHLDPAVAGKVLERVRHTSAPEATSTVFGELSERELQVLQLLARGMTNQAIANELHLSWGTVRNYVSTILDKLGVDDRTQAALLAQRYGLTAPGNDQPASEDTELP